MTPKYEFKFDNNSGKMLGLLAAVVIIGKLIMQNLWVFKLHWDTQVRDQSLLREWVEFKENLSDLAKIENS